MERAILALVLKTVAASSSPGDTAMTGGNSPVSKGDKKN